VHEKDIEIDPKKVESNKKVLEPMCKCDVHKLLGKINYLCRFIANLAGKIDSYLLLIRFKHENEFVWGSNRGMHSEELRNILCLLPC
jgi:hypothetical protein